MSFRAKLESLWHSKKSQRKNGIRKFYCNKYEAIFQANFTCFTFNFGIKWFIYTPQKYLII